MATAKNNPKKAATSNANPSGDAQAAQLPETAASAAPAMPSGWIDKERQALVDNVRQFITQNGLSAVLPGSGRDRPFVNVEGWQYAAELRDLTVVVESCKRINYTQPDEVIYEAHVRVYADREAGSDKPRQVGAGWALCSSRERAQPQHEFAVCSMAQTRATGKALRNILGWVIAAAGFASTPREEMEQALAPAPVTTQASPVASHPAEGQPTQDDGGQREALEQDQALAEGEPENAPPARRATNANLRPEGAPKSGPVPAAQQPVPPTQPQERAQLTQATQQINQAVATLKNVAHNPAAFMKGQDLIATGREGKPIDPAKELNADNQYADYDQKVQIIDLLGKPYFTNAERSKMLLGLNAASAARITEAHGKMRTEYENRHRLNPSLEDGSPAEDEGHPALR